MFTFTPLLGAQSSSKASQSIVELDGGVKVLVDVGWDERFDTQQLAELEKHVPSLSFILLTHATISHIGAFVHCCKHVPLFSQIPIYATSPVIAFGRTLLQDLYTSNPIAATFVPASGSSDDQASTSDGLWSDILKEAPTPEEISKYFSLITPLKYSQPHQPNASYFSAPLEGLTLTAFNAGHTLGGTIWHIQHGMESIVYAVDWHQARENVIAGAAWFGGVGGSEVIEQLRKPTALVCSSQNGDKVALSGGRNARDNSLIDHIRSSVNKRGTVLIPTDSSARILELAWILEKAWTLYKDDPTLQKAKIYLASRSGHATLRHARSLLEWMDDSIVREFEGDEDHVVRGHKRSGSKQTNNAGKPARPFEFKHIKVIERQSQLEKILKTDEPRVIIASDTTLEWGISRDLVKFVAHKPENLFILTERSEAGLDSGNHSTQVQLWRWFQDRLDGVALEKDRNDGRIEQVHSGGRTLQLREIESSPLNAVEAQKYQQYVASQIQMRESQTSGGGRGFAVAQEALMEDDDSSSESDDSGDEQQGRVLNVSNAMSHASRNRVALSDEDLGVAILVRKRGVHDFDVRNKRGRNAVFPYVHTRHRGDEFGDFIKPEDFLREEEKALQTASIENKQNSQLGQKRKWDESVDNPMTKNGKRQHMRQNGADSTIDDDEQSTDDSDASEDEVESPLQAPQGPRKAVVTVKEVSVNARLAFVDFAGVHDQRSLQMLIPLIDPKKLILVHGSGREIEVLAADCKELLSMKVAGVEEQSPAEIFTPRIGETVDASVDTNAWVVKLSRDLARRLQWQNVKSIGIVTVTGQLKAEVIDNSDMIAPSNAKKLKLEVESHQPEVKINQTLSYEPVLEPVPVTLAASTRSSSQPIHVGDLRLADLRRLMNSAGHGAEFRGEGILLVDGMIAVRKLASGKIVVEGAPVNSVMSNNSGTADSFTSVRRRIYEGLAVVASG